MIHADGDFYEGEWDNDKGIEHINCKHRDKANMFMLMVQVMRVVGKMINKMVLDMKYGLMVLVIRVHTYKGKKKVMVYLDGQMNHIMKGNSWIMQYMVWDAMFGVMVEHI